MSGLPWLPTLVAAQIFLHACLTGMRIAAPLSVLNAGGSQWQVGVLFGVVSLGPILAAIPVSRMVDRRGYRPTMKLCLAFSITGAVVALLATFSGPWQFALMCVAGPVLGAGANAGMIVLQRTAARAATGPVALRRVFAWTGLAPSISNVIGPLLAGIALDVAGDRGAFTVLLALPLIALLLSRRASPPELPPSTGHRLEGSMRDLWHNPVVRRMFLVDFLMIAAWDVHAFVVPTLGHERGLSGTAIGLVSGMFAAGVLLIRALIPWISHRIREGRVLITAMLVTAGVFAVYPLGDSAVFMGACALVLGVAIGSANPMVLSALHQAVQDSLRGRVLALRSISINAVALVMPMGFAALVTAVGWSPLLWTTAASVGAGSAAVRRRRRS